MANKKIVSVLSTAAISSLLAAAVGTTALAKVDGLVVKNAEGNYLNYELEALQKSLVDATLGNEEGSLLFNNFDAARKDGSIVSYHDDQVGFVDSKEVAKAATDAALNGGEFELNNFTENAEETTLPETVYTATVKDGKVVKGEEVEATNGEKGDLKVTSVSAINAAQVKVTFNNTLTGDAKDEVTDLSNYTLNNSKGNEIDSAFAAVDVEEGSKVAILTVDHSKIGDDDDSYQNQANFELVLDKEITGTEISKEFTVSDFDIPEVTSAEIAGIRTIKVKLSEPVVAKSGSELADVFEINGGDYSIDTVVPINNGTELNIVLYSDLKDGEEVTVKAKAEAEDFAGYSLKKSTHTVDVKLNSEDLAIVGYKDAKDSEITLVFNKDVQFKDGKDLEKFYHTSSKNKATEVTIDGNEVTIEFSQDNLLPETAYIYVDADALEDLWDKTNDDLNVKATINKDLTRPEVKEAKQDEDANNKIIVTFSEEIDKTSAEEEDNYTVTDKDGNKVRISSATKSDDDEVTLKLSKDLEDGKEYKVAIEDVEDLAGNKVSDTTKTFKAKETTSILEGDVKPVVYNAGESTQKLVIDFGRKMLADGSRYAINNLENYDLVTVGNTLINLSKYENASIKVVEDAHKVEIKLPGKAEDLSDDQRNLSGNGNKITINRLEDSNGNKSDILNTIDISGNSNSIGLDEDNDSPIAVNQKTIKLIFEDQLNFESSDITLEYGNGNTSETFKKVGDIIPSTKKVTTENGKTIVTYELKESDELNYNGTYTKKDDPTEYTVAVVTNEKEEDIESENKYGDKLGENQTWILKDEIAPALAKLDETDGGDVTAEVKTDKTAMDDRDDYEDAVRVVSFDSENKTATIELTFEEDLTNANINAYTFKTDDDDVKVKTAELKSDDSKVITLTVDVADDSTDYVTADDFVGLGITTGSNEIFDAAPDANKALVNTEVQVVKK